MNLINTFLGFFPKIFKTKTTLGNTMQTIAVANNGVTGLPEKIATVFTCCKILSENLSRMPMYVEQENQFGKIALSRHRLSYLLRFRPNNYQNAQNFWSTVEYHRNYYGNAFVRVYKNQFSAYPQSFEILHPALVKDYYFKGGALYYKIYNVDYQQDEEINAEDILHFRGLSEDGIIGLSPLVAIERQTNINERATSTMDNFYKNNATSPHALTTELPGQLSGPAAGILKESVTDFNNEYTGPQNAGKMIRLPIGSKLQTIAMQFADAQLIETLRFTREDISAAYGIPLFMVDGSAEKLDVEQLTTLFKNNTMGPVVAIYINEMNAKLLTRAELEAGQTIAFDILSLIAMDYNTLVTGIQLQTSNGLMTPNEGARKLGNKPINNKQGDRHYMQAQYIPLEDYDKYSPLLKNDPNLKTNRDDEK